MDSLKTLSTLTVPALRSAARTTDNRQLAICLNCLAGAKEAYSVGDKVNGLAYLEKAKTAHVRAQEDEHGQVRRVQETAAAIGLGTVETGTHRGIGPHTSMLAINRQARHESARRSR